MMTQQKAVRKKTVMLVDDEAPWLQVMTSALESEAFNVVTAESGELALKQMHRKKPDLILSDVRMPDMNGFDLFEKVRGDSALKKVPFVFMSFLDDYDARRVAKELGADDYVAKPFDTSEAKLIVLDLLTRLNRKK
jgi:DNA-binding response OmpR family regulator